MFFVNNKITPTLLYNLCCSIRLILKASLSLSLIHSHKDSNIICVAGVSDTQPADVGHLAHWGFCSADDTPPNAAHGVENFPMWYGEW